LIRLSFSAACECAGFKRARQCRTDSDLRRRSSQRLLTESGSNWIRTVDARKLVALRISLQALEVRGGVQLAEKRPPLIHSRHTPSRPFLLR